MDMVFTSLFWLTLGQIIMINILLSGDNAVVIALASRNLPPKQQKQAILFGSFGAIALRIVLTFFAVVLLSFPYLKIIGGLLLVWIGIKMLIPESDEEDLEGHSGLWPAIKTIIVADFVMSLDNVLGVAAAAKGNTVLLVLGLAISIPLIIYGSTLVLKLMERFGFVVVLGAGLLGWVAGEMLVTDPSIAPWMETQANWAHTAAPIMGAIAVVATGMWRARIANALMVPAVEIVEVPNRSDYGSSEWSSRSSGTGSRDASIGSGPMQRVALGGNEPTDELPIGYREISSTWRTGPDGRRIYAALEDQDAYRRRVPISSRVHDHRSYLG